jgi:AcrR family transcriptional regulator
MQYPCVKLEFVGSEDEQVRRRTGGRSARVRGAVLQATLQATAEHGPGAVTISEIARRAGVHATSIQRRWGSRENVMLDALMAYSDEKLPIPDTGTLRDDLIAFGRSMKAYLATPLGEALARTMAATEDDAALAANRAQFWEARYGNARAIIDRAINRNEVAAGTNPELALDMLVAPLHFRKLLTRQPIDDSLVERIVDTLMHGLVDAGCVE